MLEIMNDVEFKKLSFDEQKQHLINVIDSMDEKMIKGIHNELDSVGAFNMNPNSSQFEEAIKKIIEKYEDEE